MASPWRSSGVNEMERKFDFATGTGQDTTRQAEEGCALSEFGTYDCRSGDGSRLGPQNRVPQRGRDPASLLEELQLTGCPTPFRPDRQKGLAVEWSTQIAQA